jgi:Na+/proline symporter
VQVRAQIAACRKGLRGLLLTAFFAAYMSTLSTQINWGASYLVNDVYKRFIRREETDRHYAWVSRIASVIILLCGAIATTFVTSVEQAWKLLLALGGGTGALFMLRWYWWRINAAAEIAAMVAALLFFIVVQALPKSGALSFLAVGEYQTCVIAFLTIIVWLVAMYATPAESTAVLEKFYRKVRPASFGWKPIKQIARDVEPDDSTFVPSLVAAACGIVLIYTILPATGAFIFGEYVKAVLLLLVAGGAAALLIALLSRIGWERFTR